MPRLKEKLDRVEHDFYPTEKTLTDILRANVDISGSVLECCAGDHAIAKCFDGCITNDPYHELKQDYRLDASDPFSWSLLPPVDWVVTNPPFKLAPSILPKALQHASVGVAFLLRLSYLEPCQSENGKPTDRGDWLIDNADQMIRQIVLNPRPQFRSDTNRSDNVTVCWLVWRKDFSWSLMGIDCPFSFIHGWR